MEREYTLEELLKEIEKGLSIENKYGRIFFKLTTIEDDAFYQSIEQLPEVFYFNKKTGFSIDHCGINFENQLHEWNTIRLTGFSIRDEHNSRFFTLIIGFKNGKFKTIGFGNDQYREDVFKDYSAAIQLYKKKHHFFEEKPSCTT